MSSAIERAYQVGHDTGRAGRDIADAFLLATRIGIRLSEDVQRALWRGFQDAKNPWVTNPIDEDDEDNDDNRDSPVQYEDVYETGTGTEDTHDQNARL